MVETTPSSYDGSRRRGRADVTTKTPQGAWRRLENAIAWAVRNLDGAVAIGVALVVGAMDVDNQNMDDNIVSGAVGTDGQSKNSTAMYVDCTDGRHLFAETFSGQWDYRLTCPEGTHADWGGNW